MVYATVTSVAKMFMLPFKSVRSPCSYSQRQLGEIYEGKEVFSSVLFPPHFRNTNQRVSTMLYAFFWVIPRRQGKETATYDTIV
jgi:hypothetical protein